MAELRVEHSDGEIILTQPMFNGLMQNPMFWGKTNGAKRTCGIVLNDIIWLYGKLGKPHNEPPTQPISSKSRDDYCFGLATLAVGYIPVTTCDKPMNCRQITVHHWILPHQFQDAPSFHGSKWIFLRIFYSIHWLIIIVPIRIWEFIPRFRTRQVILV